MLKVGTWNVLLLYRLLKRALKEVEVTAGKPRQRTEQSGEASLGRSRLEPGCRTNMTMTVMVMITVQVPVWCRLDFNWTALNVCTHLIICILII